MNSNALYCREGELCAHPLSEWNGLPDAVVGAETLDAFKRLLSEFLGDKLFDYVD